MACKENQIAILKSQTVKLDDNTIMFLCYMFHTADKEAKLNGQKSFYRYEGFVMKTEDFKNMLDEMKSDAHAMETWTWPTKDPWWKPEYYLAYYYDSTKLQGAKWYKNRFKKILTWDAFMDLAKNGVKHTAKGQRTSESAKYELDNYVTDDGQQFNIDSPETMLKLVGKCFGHPVVLKRDIPKA